MRNHFNRDHDMNASEGAIVPLCCLSEGRGEYLKGENMKKIAIPLLLCVTLSGCLYAGVCDEMNDAECKQIKADLEKANKPKGIQPVFKPNFKSQSQDIHEVTTCGQDDCGKPTVFKKEFTAEAKFK